MGQPAQDYWLMVYDYMSEGNGPVPLELKVRTQPMPPRLMTVNPESSRPCSGPETFGERNEPNQPGSGWIRHLRAQNAAPRLCLA